MKQPQNKIELPKWFNEENYKMVSSFDHFDYLHAISGRIFVFNWESFREQNKINIISWLSSNKVEFDLEKINNLFNTNFRVEKQPSSKRSRYFNSFDYAHKLFYGTSEIPSVSEIDKETINKYAELNSEIIRNKFNQKISVFEFDYMADETTLINEFSTLIREVRKRNKLISNTSNISDAYLNRLIRYKVLEYFDLLIWFNFKNYSVTDPIISNLLFLDENEFPDPVSTLRKNSKKLLNEILTPSVFDSLATQISNQKDRFIQ